MHYNEDDKDVYMTDEMKDAQLLSTIICMICDYSVKNGMNPDESIEIIAENLLKLREISTFANWKVDK